MQLILPKTYAPPETLPWPLFFLAGPVLGGGDWQRKCAIKISRKLEEFYAIIPCRYDKDDYIRNLEVSGDPDKFISQTHWERHYLDAAGDKKFGHRGCILFWLCCESKTDPRTDGNPYSRDTYGELGEWRGRLMYDPGLRVAIGAEEGFPGLRVIKKNFDAATRSDFPIHKSLDETVEAAIKIALS